MTETKGRLPHALDRLMGIAPIAFALRVLERGSRARAGAYAAQIAFFVLMSAFPFAILILQLIRIAPVSQESMLFAIDGVFPAYLLTTMHGILQEVLSTSFGLVPLTVVAMLWTTSKVMHAVVMGLDSVHGAQQGRNWATVRLWSIVYTLVLALIVLFLAGSTVVWQPLQDFLIRHRPHGVSLSTYTSFLRTVYTLLVGTFALAVLYKVLPYRRPSFVSQLPGAIFTMVCVYLFSAGIAIYVSDFDGFSAYGSLTTLTLVMFLLYFSCYFIMFGAVINVELQASRKRRADALEAPPAQEGDGEASQPAAT